MGTSRNAEERHLGGIAAKRDNIILDPLQEEELIMQAEIQ